MRVLSSPFGCPFVLLLIFGTCSGQFDSATGPENFPPSLRTPAINNGAPPETPKNWPAPLPVHWQCAEKVNTHGKSPFAKCKAGTITKPPSDCELRCDKEARLVCKEGSVLVCCAHAADDGATMLANNVAKKK